MQPPKQPTTTIAGIRGFSAKPRLNSYSKTYHSRPAAFKALSRLHRDPRSFFPQISTYYNTCIVTVSLKS